MHNRSIKLPSGKLIGPGQPCFIVAEIGNNHQGKLELAKDMVLAAAESGADAVKFQKRNINSLLTKEARDKAYTHKNSFGPTYGEHRKALELSINELTELKKLSEHLGLIFFASAWDQVSLSQMHALGVELIKIGSADLVNIPLLRQAGAYKTPVILSTGMSTMRQIDRAVRELRSFHEDIFLLHCNSSYPCPEEEIGLPVMEELFGRYQLPVGYSGHEQGLAPSLAAAARGACIIERHFTLNKNFPGTDHQASLEPDEFKSLSLQIRQIEKSLALKEKKVFAPEKQSAQKLRKSIAASRDIPAGKTISAKDITVKSPGTGLSPLFWDDIIGRKTDITLYKDQLFPEDFLQNESSPIQTDFQELLVLK